jgi:hypothetical protein
MRVNESDLETVADGIRKLPESEALEVSLCPLSLLMALALEGEESERLRFLAAVRGRLLGS